VIMKYRVRNLRHVVAFVRSRLLVGGIIKDIDLDAFSVFQNSYCNADPRPHGYSKYLDIRYWMAESLMRYLYYGLDRSQPLRILDIGTGCGYFPYICTKFGHQAMAVDLDEVPMYNEIIRFLKVNRLTLCVEKFKPFPDFGMKFDLITAFMIKFNCHYSSAQWGVDEWKFLLDDFRANHLTEDGKVILHFNANKDGSFVEPNLKEYFLNLGGTVYRNQVVIGAAQQSKRMK